MIDFWFCLKEAEKTLHYLETIGPAPLLGQLLVALGCTAAFLLSEAQTVSVLAQHFAVSCVAAFPLSGQVSNRRCNLPLVQPPLCDSYNSRRRVLETQAASLRRGWSKSGEDRLRRSAVTPREMQQLQIQRATAKFISTEASLRKTRGGHKRHCLLVIVGLPATIWIATCMHI